MAFAPMEGADPLVNAARPTVVIVDDEPMVVRALQRLLRRSFDLLCVGTPAEALEAVDANDVAVVLTDQRMPDMGGSELLASVRRHDPRVMGLLITGFADIDAVADAINQSNVVGYLRKPWRDEDVLAAVERAVDANAELRSRSRERAELMRQQEVVRVLVDHSPVGVAVLGPAPELVCLQVNAPFLHLMEGASVEVQGSPLQKLLSDEAWQAIQTLCARASRTRETMTSPELPWASGRATVKHVTCTVSALPAASGVEEFVLTASDITATVQAREEARELAARQGAILEQMPSGVVVVDAAGRTLLSNDMARSLHQDPAREAPTGIIEGPRDANSGRALLPEELPLARALAGERVERFEYRQQNWHDSPQAWIRASAMPLLNASGVITGAVAVYTDVTADHLADQARTVSLASAGHELRTPLTAIQGFAGLLLGEQMGKLADPQREAIKRIVTSAHRLNLLVEDVMAITSIEVGQLDLHPSAVDVRAVLESVIESFKPQTDAKHQQVTLDLPPNPVLAWVDGHRLEQIVCNLVSNAHKYTPDGGHITVLASQDSRARISVKDTGVGLTPDEISRLFTKFYRARNKATLDVPGTGLGLAITRALVERQGGTMTIESTPDVGSTFGFSLPLHHQS